MFSVGIVCKWIDGEWFAEADFLSDGFAKNRIRLKILSEYGDRNLAVPVQSVIAASAKFPQLEWQRDASLYVEDDGENPEIPLPEDWRSQLEAVIAQEVFNV